ncbi:putative vomeronasal receptor-like protein 4 [Sciurus carolinensis]|uniref:putative vomeronasal receptor-like protein 4 n=1 Tax=Sciurus carolinensis TaxID=30640 RepID=UPI001FB4F063|nr:putative vomeronasal receptor-like protein 4 [Sciurus carolinensis]
MVLNLLKGTTFMFLTGLGSAGNIFVLMNYICFFRRIEKKSIPLILIHLAFTNILMLFTKGTPRTIASSGLQNLLGDVSCKILVYLERVTRGLSISTTSLLTVVQAVTISPRASRWRRLQPRSAQNTLPLLLFFWILNAIISMNLPFYIKHISSLNTSEVSNRYTYCYFVPKNFIIRWIFLALMVLRDATFQGVMGWSSGYMMFLLHKHHQHVLYLQTSKLLYRTPPEMKAAQSVLLLMLCFLFFYWTDCFMTVYSTVSLENDSIALDVQEFLTLGYAILSPFVLIHRDGHLAACCHAH